MTELIVNADDFGEYRCVSAGILQCIDVGSVLATGVMANSPLFGELAAELVRRPWVDYGVHLNLSRGRPLTARMADECMAGSGGLFSGKFRAALAVLSGRLPVACVEQEWRAQIERALDAGLTLRFLNSHEHVHLIPALRRLTGKLARAYGIPWVRVLRPERSGWSPGAWLRSAAVALLQGRAVDDLMHSPVCIGLAASGRLDPFVLRQLLARLPAQGCFELMCHPGQLDLQEVSDRSLLAYHRWDDELRMLCSPDFPALCAASRLTMTRFRDLRRTAGGLTWTR